MRKTLIKEITRDGELETLIDVNYFAVKPNPYGSGNIILGVPGSKRRYHSLLLIPRSETDSYFEQYKKPNDEGIVDLSKYMFSCEEEDV